MKEDIKNLLGDEMIAFEAMDVGLTGVSADDSQNAIVQLQLTMATNSINHEYARIEFEDEKSTDRQEELLEYMSNCRDKYLEARESLLNYDAEALKQFERDLYQQKLKTLHRFNA